jgi:hypothetical protein
MHWQQWVLLALIAICGGAVIWSYIQGISNNPGSAEKLWGNVKGNLRIFNFITMLLSVVGFLAFTYYILLRVNPENAHIAGLFNYFIFFVLYALILIPSAFWMPLTYSMLANPSTGTWLALRGVLFLVGLGSIGLLAALLTMQPRTQDFVYWLAVGGAAAFCLQTAILDSFVWPAYFQA